MHTGCYHHRYRYWGKVFSIFTSALGTTTEVEHQVSSPLVPPPYLLLAGKSFAVLGFGSSNYPRFCAAADLFHTTLLTLGGSALLNPQKADALIGEERVVWPWLKQVVRKMAEQTGLEKSAVTAVEQQLPTTGYPTVSFQIIQCLGERTVP